MRHGPFTAGLIHPVVTSTRLRSTGGSLSQRIGRHLGIQGIGLRPNLGATRPYLFPYLPRQPILIDSHFYQQARRKIAT